MGSLVAAFSLNRLVVLLTPIFAGAAGWVVTRIAEWMPGANLDETELTALFIAAFLAAVEMARQWLKGWSKHEENQALLEMAGRPESPAGAANREETTEDPGLPGEPGRPASVVGPVAEGGEFPMPEGATRGKPL